MLGQDNYRVKLGQMVKLAELFPRQFRNFQLNSLVWSWTNLYKPTSSTSTGSPVFSSRMSPYTLLLMEHLLKVMMFCVNVPVLSLNKDKKFLKKIQLKCTVVNILQWFLLKWISRERFQEEIKRLIFTLLFKDRRRI